MPAHPQEDELKEMLDDGSTVVLPPRFCEVSERIRAVVEGLEADGVPSRTVLMALTTELMPRLLVAYGPHAAAVLNRLAGEIATADQPPPSAH